MLGQGGAERVTVTLLKYFDRSKFDITLVLMKAKGDYIKDIPDDVELIDLKVKKLWFILLPLAKAIKQVKPDIILSISGGTNAPAVIARKLSGLHPRLLISERNILKIGELTAKRRVLIALKKFTYSGADAILTVSEGVREDLIHSFNLPPDIITTTFNPIVSEALYEAANEPLNEKYLEVEKLGYILGVGRMVPQKNFELLIEAFKEIKKKYRLKLVILGAGPHKLKLEAMVKENGLRDDVLMPGFDKNPFKWMSKCRVFVLSSNNEGLPGALIQAMACGAPVVSTDCPSGPSEIISGLSENGILIPMNDKVALVNALEKLLADRQKAALFATQGKQRAKKFEIVRVAKIYEEALIS